MTGRLDGKTALVTGAGGALGSTIVKAFATEGIRGVLATDVRAEALGQIRADLLAQNVDAIVESLDVTNGEAFDTVAVHAVDRWGCLDILVNCAGMVPPNARIHNVSTEDWQRSLDVNLTGTFHGVRAATRVMRKRGGSVVNIASVSAVTAWPYAAPYCAAKAGVVHLTRVAALEYAKERIRVNCVCPGAFPSGIHSDLPDAAMAAIESRHPLGLGRPEDIVGAVVHLASDESAWTTGQALNVDGGYSLP